MCGFVGELRSDGMVERDRLYRMNNALVHRGPDESQIVIGKDGRWGLAHRRLCIVDIAGGKQPMADADRGLIVAFNGEIYDHDRMRDELRKLGHVFYTKSDTEVLLALYAQHGLECFDRLRGEFAFAIVDQKRRRLVLGRDRLGLKPLFYAPLPSGGLVFGSEIKALLRHPELPRKLDPLGLLASIAVADAPGDTAFAGVKQLRHAHFGIVDFDSTDLVERRYWDAWSNRGRDLPRTFDEQKEAVRAAVDEAIRLRLRADVPVGAYLSGGLDSSLVCGVMAARGMNFDAFALAFEESPRHDEFPFAQAVAKRYPNIRLHRIPVTYNDTVRRLGETVRHLERPFGNLHSVAKIISAQYARQHVVCVLTGDGGDESFCGYSTFWLQDALQRANYSLPAIKGNIRKMQQEAAGIGGNRYYLAGGLAKRVGPETAFLEAKLGFRPVDLATAVDAERRVRAMMNPDFCRPIEGSVVQRLADRLAETMPDAAGADHAALLQYVQMNSQVPGYIATIADRSEWAGSVEARPPLFDHKVVELAMGLPLDAKLQGDREKHILREAYRDLLPVEVIERRKQAFLAPPAPFSCADGKLLLDRYLSSKAVADAGIWQQKTVNLVKGIRAMAPRNRLVNLTLTVMLTAQILHDQFIANTP